MDRCGEPLRWLVHFLISCCPSYDGHLSRGFLIVRIYTFPLSVCVLHFVRIMLLRCCIRGFYIHGGWVYPSCVNLVLVANLLVGCMLPLLPYHALNFLLWAVVYMVVS